MKITKNKKELVIRIPLYQDSYDAIGEKISSMLPNVIGVIAGERCTISQLIDLGYKDDVQEGSELVVWSDFAEENDKEDFRKLCSDLGIAVWEHEVCSYCGKVIYGAFYWGKKGNMCSECHNKEDKKKQDFQFK